jgi:predicted small lipoprotein YifL
MRPGISQITVLLGLLLFAGGCGQRGPLYLPGDPDEGRTVIPGMEAEEEEELADEEADVDAEEEPPRP